MTNLFTTKRIQVPGVLPDTALQEQLKQFSAQAKDQQRSAPPPGAAYSMADRVMDQYLDKPLKQQLSDSTAVREAVQKSTAGVSVDGGTAAKAAARLLTPWWMPAAEQAGTLNAEEQVVEQQRRVEDAKAAETALRNKAEVRERLRGLSDEEASQLGLPVPPGGVRPDMTEQAAAPDAPVAKSAAEAVTQAETVKPTQTWWLNALQTGVRSLNQTGTGAARGAMLWAEYLLPNGADTVPEYARKAVEALDSEFTKLLPGDPARAKDFVTDLSAGAGSFTAFLMAGYIGRALGAAPATVAAPLGAALGGEQQYSDAEDFGATEFQKFMALLMGSGLGLSEALPIDRMFTVADRASGGAVRRLLRTTAAGSITEFMQEVGQAVGEDVIAKNLYDENREFDIKEYARRGLVGAITGGFGGAVTSVMGVEPPAAPGPVVDTEQEAIAKGAIDLLQREFDAITPIGEGAFDQPVDMVEGIDAPAAPEMDIGVVEIDGMQIEPAPATETPEFQSWFSDSKVVDKNGAPLVLYHGSTATDPIRVFDTTRVTARGRGDQAGTYFTTDPNTASNYTRAPGVKSPRGRVYSVYLSLKNPLDTTAAIARFQKKGMSFGDAKQEALKALDRSVHDGIVFRGNSLNPPEYVAFKPTQIKSVRNQGTFNPNDPDILASVASTPMDEFVGRALAPARPSRGGSMPVNDDGLVELTHWSRQKLPVIDPAKRGTGPYRGQERARLVGSDAVDRAYYGVNAVENVPAGKFDEALERRTGPSGKMRKSDREQRYFDFLRRAGYVKEGGLGSERHTVLVDPDRLYNWYEDPLGLKAGIDRSLAGPEQVTQYERIIRDAGFDGVYFSSSPLGQTALMFTPETPVEQAEFDAMTSPAKQQELATQIPGLKGVMKHLTPEERGRLKLATAKKLVDIFEKMPDPKEMAAVAVSGRAKRGWYARSARALVDIFGAEDAPRFAALLAALSPQVSVESNAVNALSVWTAWNAAQRPTDRASILRIMAANVQGGGTTDSVLPAWIDNTIRALVTPDATTVQLSGPKVNSFMRNLQGVTIEVTNDAWMANYANVDQALFRAAYTKQGSEKIGGRGVGYMAMSAAVRAAADSATRITGQQWTPAEVQETVWSWAKTLYERMDSADETRGAAEILKAGGVTDADIASTPDFASLFASGIYRNLLERGGYDVSDGRGDETDGSDGGGRSVFDAEGTGLAQGAFERHLLRAARRLEERHERHRPEGPRQPVAPATAEEPFPGDLPSQGDGGYSLEDTFEGRTYPSEWDDFDAMIVGGERMERLPGLPASSTGPVASVVRAAQAYASSAGIPFRRQAEYVTVDVDRAARIAQAYDAMAHNPDDPKVKAAFRAMIDETVAQFQYVKASGLDIDFIKPGQPDPYPGGPKEVLDDLQRGHLWVFPTDQGFGTLTEAEATNPLLEVTGEVVKGRTLLANDVFRIVHDFFGHGLEGAGFGARGEENAWQAHMRLYTEAALPAVTSETRGQNSWVNYGPHGAANRANQRETVYADQKTGIMPDWTWKEGVGADSEVIEPMFAGGNAGSITGYDEDRLQAAKRMLDEGRTNRDIWEATGWFLGVDNQWRFEISDGDAEFTARALRALNDAGRVTATLGSVMDHPKLYAAYPELRDIIVELDLDGADASGWFDETKRRIKASAPNEEALMNEVLLHEVQHAVQAIEGFNRGANQFSGELYEGATVEQRRRELDEATARVYAGQGSAADIVKARKRLTDAAAYEYYRRTAGEVEARNVEERAMQTRGARQAAREGWAIEPFTTPFPEDTADVPVDQQIVIMRSSTSLAQSMMAPDTEAMAGGTSSGRGTYKAEPKRPAQGIPEGQAQGQDTDEDLSLAKISRNFVGLLDLTARQGRLTVKGSNVMGQYSRRSSVVRLRTWNDLTTLVHEGGHALHDAMGKELKAFTDTNFKELMDVGTALYGGDLTYANRETHVREGFAEFFRVYTLNRAFADRKYPKLVTEFEAVIDAVQPQLKEQLGLIGRQFAAWLQLPSVTAMRNTIVPARQETGINAAIQELREVGFGTWYQEFARQTVEQSINRYASLNSLVNSMLNIGEQNQGAAIDLKRSDDPRTLVRLARNTGARAMIQLTDGVMDYRSVTPSTRGLRDALVISQGGKPGDNLPQLDETRLQDFDTYLVALRALDEYRRMDEGLIERPPVQASRGDVLQTIADLEKTYDTAFANAAAIVHEYGMGLWRKQYDAGLMSKETYQEGLERHFYAPLQRDMSDRQGSLGPSALTGGSSIVKRFRGSDRDIVSPMAVLMHKTFALESIIAQNDVMRSLALLSDRAGKAGAFVERVPASTLLPQNFSVQEVARQLSRDENLSEVEAQDLLTILSASIENDGTITMFRPKQANASGDNLLFFWENGKLAALQLHDGSIGADVVNMMNGLGRENMPFGMEVLAMTTTAFRTAITSWPDFLIVNFIRDQLSAWIINDVGFKPFVTGIKGMADELRQNRWSKQYNASLGIMGGMNVATLHEARVNRDIDALRAKGYIAKAFSGEGFGGAVQGMARIVELSETGTRLGIFKKAFERAKKDGLTDWDASVEASYTATDYIDFGLNGSRMLLARRTIPFLNAQLQGLYKMLRTLGADEVRQRKGLRFAMRAMLKDSRGMDLSRVERQAVTTGRKAWVKMASLGLISAALHFLFEDDPDYQEAGEYLRTTGWVIPVGDGRIFYVPKPFELALVANAVERGIEHATGDGEAKSRFMRGLAMTMVPPTSPPAVQSVVEYAANKDFFTGREIVPDYMQALEPMLQYDNYTSSLAKTIGSAMNWSPMVVDHFLSSIGASAYRDIATMTNALDPNTPSMDETDAPILRRFVRDTRRGSASARDFWAQASTVNGVMRRAELTYRRLLEGGNEIAANKYLSTLGPDEKAYALLNAHFKTDAKRLNPFYRGRQVTTIVSAMRREIVSELGLENTAKGADGPIRMTAREKNEVDTALSELARREIRNTLVATRTSGWTNKAAVDVDTTRELLRALEPRVAEELERRLTKAKVYDAETVFEYWPEVRDRLLLDREQAVLKDIVSIAKVMK